MIASSLVDLDDRKCSFNMPIAWTLCAIAAVLSMWPVSWRKQAEVYMEICASSGVCTQNGTKNFMYGLASPGRPSRSDLKRLINLTTRSLTPCQQVLLPHEHMKSSDCCNEDKDLLNTYRFASARHFPASPGSGGTWSLECQTPKATVRCWDWSEPGSYLLARR
jgi:hypothetical protein